MAQETIMLDFLLPSDTKALLQMIIVFQVAAFALRERASYARFKCLHRMLWGLRYPGDEYPD